MDNPVEKELYNILNNKFLFNLKEPSLGPEGQIKIYKFLLQLYDETWTWAFSAAVPDLPIEDKARPYNFITKQFKSDLVVISGHLKRMDLGHLVPKLEDILADGKFGRIVYALIAKLEVRFNRKELSDRVGKLRKREFLLASKSLAKKIAIPKKCSSTHTFSTEPSLALPTEQANVIPLGRQLKRTPLKPSKNDHPQSGMFASPEMIHFLENPILSTVTTPIDHDERPIRSSGSFNSTFTIEPNSVHTEDKEDIVNLAKKPYPSDKAMQIDKMQSEDDGHDDQQITPMKSPKSTSDIEPTSPVHTEDKEDIVNLAKKPKQNPSPADKAMQIDKMQPEDDAGHDDQQIKPLKSPNSTVNIELTSPVHAEDNKGAMKPKRKPYRAKKAMRSENMQPEYASQSPARAVTKKGKANQPAAEAVQIGNMQPEDASKSSVETEDQEVAESPVLAKKGKANRKAAKKNILELESSGTTVGDRVSTAEKEEATQSEKLLVSPKKRKPTAKALQNDNIQAVDANKSLVQTEEQEVAVNTVLAKKPIAARKNTKAVNKNILELDSNGKTVGDSGSTAEKEEATQSEKLLVSPEKRKRTAKALPNDNVQVEDASKSSVETEDQEVAESPVLMKKANRKAANKNISKLGSNGTTMGDSGSTAEKGEATQSEKLLVSPEKRKRTAKAVQSVNVQAEDASKSSVETEDQEVAESPVLTKKGKSNRKAANKNIFELDSNGTTVGDSVSTAEKEEATQSEKLLVSPEKRKRTAKALQNDNVQAEDVNKSPVQTEEQEVAVNPILTKKSKAACKNSKPANKEVLELDNNGTTMRDNVSTAEKEETAQVKELLVSPAKPKRKRKVTKQPVSETIDLNDNDDHELPLTTQARNLADLPVKAEIKNTKSASKATEKLNFNQDTTSQPFHVQEEKKPTGVKNDPPAAKDESKMDSQLSEKPGVSKKQAKLQKSNDSEKENPVSDLTAKPAKKTKGSSKAVDVDAVSPVVERRVLRQRKHVSYLENSF